MEAIKRDMAELNNRYVQMENILGFQIMGPMGNSPRFWINNHQYV
jgi:hypothetical protein